MPTPTWPSGSRRWSRWTPLPVSYLITLGAAADTGLTVEKAQAVLVAIAPVVGSARVTAAAGAIVRGVLGAAALDDAGVPEQRTS